MLFNFLESAREHVLIVAHRGMACGNIPCNTIPAYEMALLEGADMIETDVTMGKDGTLYTFHPSMEPCHLNSSKYLPELTDEEIKDLRYVNYDRVSTQFGVNKFDELLENFKGRCYINVDKFWDHPREIYQAIKRHDMIDQIVVKSGPSEEVFRVLEELAPELPFMPIVRDTNDVHEELKHRHINYLGAEVLFASDAAEVASTQFIEKMHQDDKLVWANAIIYNYKSQLTGGHSDDTAVCGSPDSGWGWLAKRGYDLIQTDWTGPLVSYLKENNLYYR